MLRPFIVLLSLFSLISCHCEKCLEHPQDMDFPYRQGQIIVFTNDKGETQTYTIKIEGGYPPPQACSDEHTIEVNCRGSKFYYMNFNNSIDHFASFGSDVIVATIPGTVYQSIKVSAYERDKTAGLSIDKIVAGGKTYSNLLYFENADRSQPTCTSFYYNDTYGLVQYDFFDGKEIKRWYLKP